jgi:predicted nucleotidyltransferase
MPTTNLEFPKKRIADFCRRWDISALDLFGSVLRPDFRPDSDVDILVTFAPQAHWTLLDCVRMEQELTGIIGRPVDLVSRRAVEESSNPIRRRQILESAEPFYVAG